MGHSQKIEAGQREEFAAICSDTRRGFEEVIDLLLIHNEKQVSGLQPRATLNRLVAMLSVAAWERLVSDIGALSRYEAGDMVEPGMSRSQGFNKLGGKGGGRSKAVSTLAAASDGRLPDAWRIRLMASGSGKSLRFEPPLEGLDSEAVETVDWWIEVRHKVAHRAIPQLDDWVQPTDAADGQTVNTTTARSAFTLFLQLADQTIRAIAESAEFDDPQELWLPEDWLTGRISPRRGVTNPDELVLWKGAALGHDSNGFTASLDVG
ncbi:hypothetical protein [Rhodococcus kronopolitis]|uniref:RiboL-PSP-HEPN domain-containing protein n=1 Tax=Rhodococcus kronopolitis TaxID=1460226 RepID=A0ABV9FUZ1_9NOCA